MNIENSAQNAVIQFKGYRVTEMGFHCDAGYEFPNGEIPYSFGFAKECTQLSDNEIQENIGIHLFYAEEGGQNYDNSPFRLSVEIAGRFASASPWQPEWEQNAMAILFPYLRSIVTTISCNTGREPIILPTLNIVSLFDTQNET